MFGKICRTFYNKNFLDWYIESDSGDIIDATAFLGSGKIYRRVGTILDAIALGEGKSIFVPFLITLIHMRSSVSWLSFLSLKHETHLLDLWSCSGLKNISNSPLLYNLD